VLGDTRSTPRDWGLHATCALSFPSIATYGGSSIEADFGMTVPCGSERAIAVCRTPKRRNWVDPDQAG
jgi:hypothetical protein